MRVSLIQSSVMLGSPANNVRLFVDKIRQAMKDNPDVVVLPEMWNTSFAWDNINVIVDRDGAPSAEIIGKLAGQEEINIVAGSVSDKRNEKIYNTVYVFDKQGKVVGTYDKMHLISLMRENEFITPGDKLGLFELDGVKCGAIICYDLRFPELSRALALQGAQVIFVPAQWPKSRAAHWRALIIARAIENQVYMVAVNRVGVEDDTIYGGHSMVVNPWGEIVYEAGENASIVAVDLDFELQKKVRDKMSIFADRRPDCYESLTEYERQVSEKEEVQEQE